MLGIVEFQEERCQIPVSSCHVSSSCFSVGLERQNTVDVLQGERRDMLAVVLAFVLAV